ncbi:LacI family DNA-binding transcriptional regulator [Streptomyces sp. CA-106131]|uniref:LacI family DNA-binding transcriptional regulator n=1 Tax=Streptomyces sp. CA-106131 TaxID=3240045 RepID=UPI003D90BC03
MAQSTRSSGSRNPLVSSASPTIKDVAAAAGVSLGTVSNYLNRPNSVAPKTRAKVQKVVEELGFVRNAGAALMRSGRARTIGLVVLDVTNPFFTELARGAEEAARERDLLIILCNSDEDPDKEQRYLEVLEEQRVLGVLISAVDGKAAGVDRLRQRGTSVVLVESARPNFCSVRADDVGGGDLAAEHLIGLGHRELIYVSASLSVRQYKERLEGVRHAMARHGLPEGALTIVEQGLKGSTMDGRLAGEQVLAGRLPGTGIVCSNDLVALGVIAALVRGGVRIPQDVSIVGYDDIELAQQGVLALTTVQQPKQSMGRTATQLLIEEADQGGRHAHQQIVFQPELVVRESTGPAPSARRRRLDASRQHAPHRSAALA